MNRGKNFTDLPAIHFIGPERRTSDSHPSPRDTTSPLGEDRDVPGDLELLQARGADGLEDGGAEHVLDAVSEHLTTAGSRRGLRRTDLVIHGNLPCSSRKSLYSVPRTMWKYTTTIIFFVNSPKRAYLSHF